jgi:hypothetical protein
MCLLLLSNDSFLRRGRTSDASENQRYDEKNHKHHEKNPGNFRRDSSNAEEAQGPSDQGDNEKQ